MIDPTSLKFDANGLIPAVVQDHDSKEVLTVAYMNRESLAITLSEKRTCFYSRSRNKLWRKGEESGHVQHVVSVTADCDGDALLVEVRKDGPACHTGRESCFFNPVFADPGQPPAFSLQGLYALILGRKAAMPAGSYTTYLFEKGLEKILKKVGEESAEVLIAAMKADNDELTYELADLCYHALVLMAEAGVPLKRVSDELAARHIIDKKTKQETQKSK
ncbi:MAG: bifunctional phosphoribosyl-AMP cyclohydrolase/phosphoribosyl-ATP diphosphatase HisIE [Clostridiales bacterium]|jgi:phosphoribosyl-ATP pyrophosphohydrolase/phosphoribosyl-AMP cyclohydrolase|nr:bifunctional phosphoribosyl-AMP cyclohydrolase/phosphoribosyl-ATP diphosphatase HisIE [Clostridiales bacterium]